MVIISISAINTTILTLAMSIYDNLKFIYSIDNIEFS